MFSFCIPTEFVFGSGSFKKLYQYRMPGKKALIVTTNGGSVKRLGYLNELEKQLEKSDVSFEVFDGNIFCKNTENIETKRLSHNSLYDDANFVTP